jgi:hypothetical protein
MTYRLPGNANYEMAAQRARGTPADPSDASTSRNAGHERLQNAPAYYCMACARTFSGPLAANAHCDATGHSQTWKAEQAYAANHPETAGVTDHSSTIARG